MFIKEITNFYDYMSPLVYFNCFVGMGLHRQPNISGTTYCCMCIYWVCGRILNCVMTYISFTTMNNSTDLRDNSSAMARTMYTILIGTNTSIALTASLFLWKRRKELENCWHQMSALDVKFQAIVGARNNYRREYNRLICKIILIMLVMVSVISFDSLVSDRSKESLLTELSLASTLHYPIIVWLVMDLNFCTCVSYVENKFRDLNNSLLELVEPPSSTTASRKTLPIVSRNIVIPTRGNGVKNNKIVTLKNDKLYALHEIRKGHLNVCGLFRNLNRIFGIQNLLSMGISFVMITGLSYTVYSAIAWENLTSDRIELVASAVIWVIIYAFKIWSVNHSCAIVSNESELTGEIIYELLKPTIDREFQKEVHEFGVQMLQNPVRFNACGFFTLDYTSVQAVIGSITTYLIILIQMSEVPDSTSAHSPRNDTEMSGCSSLQSLSDSSHKQSS